MCGGRCAPTSMCPASNGELPGTTSSATVSGVTAAHLSGVARFVGTVRNEHRLFSVIYARELELYHVDPPLCGYRVVAAAQTLYALRAVVVGDPDPPPPEDPVTTTLFGTTGGEGLHVEWGQVLFEAEGRSPARTLAEAGYQVRREGSPEVAAWPADFRRPVR